ncbi:MAG: FAD-binding oxidoreductase [Cyanobacteria bacterium CRU_2_1]|nr:FAD-binding oxidoreductase [Cyanobacteria bacterium RU_5_0]NJR57681.1 FAD-binding oxidoreductase [Cyanobacteria bacterium CRU_2_1]
MPHIAVIGCGVVGAMIAYELSQISDFRVMVFDRQPPAQASTGAALGVLMGIVSQKTKGKAWALRQASIRRYETLIPDLEAATGHSIPWNRQGIVMLCFEGEDLSRWEKLQEIRRTQGWQLERWDHDRLQSRCPQVSHPRATSAVYSPQDLQVDPTALTLALVAAAKQNGVMFRFDAEVTGWQCSSEGTTEQTCEQIHMGTETIAIDWVVVAAGLGSTALTQTAKQPIDICPVLGQAVRVQLDAPMGDPAFQPVITGEDIHIVPLNNGDYWVGATVEFPTEKGEILPDADRLQQVWQSAVALCPDLAQATVLKTWSGLRPRPSDRPAPIIELLTGYTNILMATGHYRNGVLLAPATAQKIREAIEGGLKDER